jgi:hypothetical protein
MASNSAGVKMSMRRESRKDKKFLASIVCAMMLSEFISDGCAPRATAARGRGAPPAGPVEETARRQARHQRILQLPECRRAAFNVEPGRRRLVNPQLRVRSPTRRTSSSLTPPRPRQSVRILSHTTCMTIPKRTACLLEFHDRHMLRSDGRYSSPTDMSS